jgi:predicted transposase/invertase (TIGR01784 family)
MLLTEWKEEDAHKVWREEAWEEAREETMKEVARKMKAKGMSLNEILELTELTVEDVLKL